MEAALRKLQKMTIWHKFQGNLEISERPSVYSFDFEKFGRLAGRNGKTANIGSQNRLHDKNDQHTDIW